MLEWERDKKREKKREKETINQEHLISRLTFNFHGALSILTFSENELTIFTKKSKREKTKQKKERKKEKKERKKRKEKRVNLRKKEKKKKSFCLSPHVRKVNLVWPCENLSFDTSLHKLMLMVLISRP